MRENRIAIGIFICILFLNQSSYSVQADPSDNFQIAWTVKGWATVVTNASTNVEETSATLNGFLISDGGTFCLYAFDYDIDSGIPYASSTIWTGPILSLNAFNQSILLLTEGELYYFRAKAITGNGTSYGGEKMFLTKPDRPLILLAKPNSSSVQITLKWVNGDGADRTVIIRKVGSYPVNRFDGVVTYNGTGTKYDDGAVVAGTHYYYRAWSYCEEGGLHQYSDNYDEDDCIAVTPVLFDLRNIVVIDDVIPLLEINLQVENKGDFLADVTITWTLVREDKGILLSSGSDIIAVASHAIVPYTIYPITMYVGLVRITFSTSGVSVFNIFTTIVSVVGGGGDGIIPPVKPPPVTPPSVTPAAAGGGLTYYLIVLLLVVLTFLFIIIVWKRRKKK